jgi:DNA repair exonuclease SbcCD ATPase subunit
MARIHDINLDEMDWDAQIRKLRSLLHEYQRMLQEYGQLHQSNAEQQKIAESEQKLQRHMRMIEALQESREKTFPYRIEGAGIMTGNEVAELKTFLRSYRRDLEQLPVGCGIRKFDVPFAEEKRYLENAIDLLEAELESRGVAVAAPPTTEKPDPVEEVSAAVRAKLQARLRLERERDEELQNSPTSMHDSIKRMYGRAIDALMEDE